MNVVQVYNDALNQVESPDVERRTRWGENGTTLKFGREAAGGDPGREEKATDFLGGS